MTVTLVLQLLDLGTDLRVGDEICPESILNATNSPTVILLSITRVAPTHIMVAVTSLLIRLMPPPAIVATLVTETPAVT